MGYNTESAEWPSNLEIPNTVKQLLDEFFSLLDDKRPEVGHILADRIFTTDGIAWFGGHPFRGPEDIRVSRENAWGLIRSRRHEILKVYVQDLDASDLLFIAKVEMHLHNGKHVDGEFTGRVVINEPKSSLPRLRLYQIWGDSSNLVKALQEK